MSCGSHLISDASKLDFSSIQSKALKDLLQGDAEESRQGLCAAASVRQECLLKSPQSVHQAERCASSHA